MKNVVHRDADFIALDALDCQNFFFDGNIRFLEGNNLITTPKIGTVIGRRLIENQNV